MLLPNFILPDISLGFGIDHIDDIVGQEFLPHRFEGLTVDGIKFDMRDPSQVQEAKTLLQQYRIDLNNGNLLKYDGKSTEIFGGGKSNLRYDEIRVQIAEEYHQGKNSLSFEDQHLLAKDIQERGFDGKYR